MLVLDPGRGLWGWGSSLSPSPSFHNTGQRGQSCLPVQLQLSKRVSSFLFLSVMRNGSISLAEEMFGTKKRGKKKSKPVPRNEVKATAYRDNLVPVPFLGYELIPIIMKLAW
ncbi:unnamed protein product [Rangifer tarandus platyrhynchus]|uniref:Uncharacterized protein n=2 Tax=Rangifer tarandus platyrhynchus TaxID=3082113 RepID=A0AC59YMY4_RANTA|nr:unnamed protein product [Rangifer tarandus platyrhynchus]